MGGPLGLHLHHAAASFVRDRLRSCLCYTSACFADSAYGSFAEPGEGSFELASGAGRGEAKGVGREWLLEGHGGEKNGRL